MAITRLDVSSSLALLSPDSYVKPQGERSRGRPTELTPTRYRILVEETRKGTPLVTASAMVGKRIHRVCMWLSYGDRDYNKALAAFESLADDDPTKTEEAFNASLSYYANFFVDMIKAAAELESDLAKTWIEQTTQPNEERTAIYREQIVEHDDGTYEVVKLLEKEVVSTSKNNDWRGTAEYLRRRFPNRWNVPGSANAANALVSPGEDDGSGISYLMGPSTVGGAGASNGNGFAGYSNPYGPRNSDGNSTDDTSPIPLDLLPIWMRKLILIIVSGGKISEGLERQLIDELDGADLEMIVASANS